VAGSQNAGGAQNRPVKRQNDALNGKVGVRHPRQQEREALRVEAETAP